MTPDRPQFKPWKEESLTSRREIFRDTLAFAGVIGAFLIGRGGNSAVEAQRTATLSKEFGDRLAKVETLSVGNSISLRGLEEQKLNMETIITALNDLASYAIQSRQMIEKLQPKK